MDKQQALRWGGEKKENQAKETHRVLWVADITMAAEMVMKPSGAERKKQVS